MDKFVVKIDKKAEEDPKEIFALTFELLKTAEVSKNLYFNISQKQLVKQLIELYYKFINTDYEKMIYNFRVKYIETEAKMEYNDEDSMLEYKGLGRMYDYIQNYNPDKKEFNIFIEGILLHQLLYKDFDDKFNSNQDKIIDEYKKELEEAKKNRNIQEFKRISSILRSNPTPTRFGGNLRNEEVDLKGVDFHVPNCKEAKEYFNSFLKPEKKIEFQNLLSSADILKYIEYCVKTSVDIIKYQPFPNGNKRTSRAILNLMFKCKNIPPVYITTEERKAYKDALIKGINGNYDDIVNFYCFKICDSIYELDIRPYEKKDQNDNEIISSPTDDSDIKFYNLKRK